MREMRGGGGGRRPDAGGARTLRSSPAMPMGSPPVHRLATPASLWDAGITRLAGQRVKRPPSLPAGPPPFAASLPPFAPAALLSPPSVLTLRASAWPTMPSATALGCRCSSRPRPRMCECAPTRSTRVRSIAAPSGAASRTPPPVAAIARSWRTGVGDTGGYGHAQAMGAGVCVCVCVRAYGRRLARGRCGRACGGEEECSLSLFFFQPPPLFF